MRRKSLDKPDSSTGFGRARRVRPGRGTIREGNYITASRTVVSDSVFRNIRRTLDEFGRESNLPIVHKSPLNITQLSKIETEECFANSPLLDLARYRKLAEHLSNLRIGKMLEDAEVELQPEISLIAHSWSDGSPRRPQSIEALIGYNSPWIVEERRILAQIVASALHSEPIKAYTDRPHITLASTEGMTPIQFRDLKTRLAPLMPRMVRLGELVIKL